MVSLLWLGGFASRNIVAGRDANDEVMERECVCRDTGSSLMTKLLRSLGMGSNRSTCTLTSRSPAEPDEVILTGGVPEGNCQNYHSLPDSCHLLPKVQLSPELEP